MTLEERLPRLVLDTGVILQATLNPNGPAGYALSLIEAGQVNVFASNWLRAEYEETLSAPEIRVKFPHLTDQRMYAILDWLDQHLTNVFRAPLQVEYARDRNDEPVLNLAVYCAADFIVTRDNDLLSLDNNPGWQRVFPNIRIVAPTALQQEIAGWHERRRNTQ